MVDVKEGWPKPAETIGGKYRLVRVLGEGGMGIVYEAMHLRLDQPVAIKFLRPDLLGPARSLVRLEREARAAARLRSPWFARVMDIDFTSQGLPYIVMELLSGRNLAEELAARGNLPAAEAVHWIRETCTAVQEAHGAGIVHRDLKPSNLFLAEQGGERRLKVLDFGISKVSGEREAGATDSQAVLGTPRYMSPEQVRSAKHVDPRADVWSLGVILYELVTGVPPFDGPSATAIAAAVVTDTPALPSTLRPGVLAALDGVVMKALAKQASARYEDVQALARALAPIAPAGFAGPDQTTSEALLATGKDERPGPSARRALFKPRPVGLCLLALGIVIAGAARSRSISHVGPCSSPAVATAPRPALPGQATSPPAADPPPDMTPAATPPLRSGPSPLRRHPPRLQRPRPERRVAPLRTPNPRDDPMYL
jgi:serine/threonine-protein kinase